MTSSFKLTWIVSILPFASFSTSISTRSIFSPMISCSASVLSWSVGKKSLGAGPDFFRYSLSFSKSILGGNSGKAARVPFLLICNFFWIAREGPINSHFKACCCCCCCCCWTSDLVDFLGCFSFLGKGEFPPKVGMSSMLVMVILLVVRSSSDTNDSSVICRSAKSKKDCTFLIEKTLARKPF